VEATTERTRTNHFHARHRRHQHRVSFPKLRYLIPNSVIRNAFGKVAEHVARCGPIDRGNIAETSDLFSTNLDKGTMPE
jgi:hypothetical protein